MMILKYPHESLRTDCAPTVPSTETTQILDKMQDAMREHGGIGLAANQLGYPYRLVVVHTTKGILRMINPRFLSKSGVTFKVTERCLSMPDFERNRTRSYSVTVRYMQESGEGATIQLKGIEAATIAHEIDHLNGKTIVDG